MTQCPVCEQPEPPEAGLSLHLDWCPRHDRETCVACKDMALKGIDEDQDHGGD